ncbi:MAG: UTP--glucose-1-phosphate uridylyltransferase, partial [Candidatus Aminicenantales bacterium]
MTIRKAVIPAAGFGTRFLPATKAVPKEMLSVVDRPLIQYTAEEAVEAGIGKIAVITSRGKSAIANHFYRSPELEQFLEAKGKHELLKEVRRISDLAEFVYIRQREALGLGHAVLMAEDFIGGEPFAVCLPDDIFEVIFATSQQKIVARELIKYMIENGSEISKSLMSIFATKLHDGKYECVLDVAPYKGKKVKLSYNKRQ